MSVKGSNYLPRSKVTLAEAALLRKYVLLANGDVVEIGTFKGGGLAFMAEHLDRKYALYSIDPYREKYLTYTDLHDYDPVFISRKYLSKFSNVFLIVGLSQNLGRYWNRQIAVLFIDGDHQYEPVKRDFVLWSRFVLYEQGFVIFHDSATKGVKATIREACETGVWGVCDKAGKITVLKRILKAN